MVLCSGTKLRASSRLCSNGFVQEQAVIQRTLDELHEDIIFRAAALTNDTMTERHQKYLGAFYEEEFNPLDGKPYRKEKRYMTPRQKIQAYINNIFHKGQQNESVQTLSKTFSGFVHAASPQIMDMCLGDPPQFYVSGMLGTPRHSEYASDLWNYFFRGLLTSMIVAKAFGDKALLEALDKYRDEFESACGTNYKAGDGS